MSEENLKALQVEEPNEVEQSIIDHVMLKKPYVIIFPSSKDGVDTMTMHTNNLSLQTLSYMSHFLMSSVQNQIGGKHSE